MLLSATVHIRILGFLSFFLFFAKLSRTMQEMSRRKGMQDGGMGLGLDIDMVGKRTHSKVALGVNVADPLEGIRRKRNSVSDGFNERVARLAF